MALFQRQSKNTENSASGVVKRPPFSSLLKKSVDDEPPVASLDYKAFFDGSRDGIVVSDTTTQSFVAANKTFRQMLGYNEAEIIKIGVKDVHPLADLPKVLSQFGEMAQGKIKTALGLPVKRKDGSIFYADISSAIVPMGNRMFLVGNFRDATERLKDEAAIKQAELRYRSLFDLSRDAIMILEPPDWKFTSGNLSAIKLFGAKDEREFISFGPWDVSPEKQLDGAFSAIKAKINIEKAMKEGSNFFEWIHKKARGPSFPATVLLSRVAIGDKTFLQATVRDITEQKKLEKDLQERMAELEKTNKLMFGRELKMAELKGEIERLKKRESKQTDKQ
ncbi:MAG: PAS domain-containing protein [Patescibacteria group bacterium]|nr:PAS domain-containing protein [Patescibacteria group bacterium]